MLETEQGQRAAGTCRTENQEPLICGIHKPLFLIIPSARPHCRTRHTLRPVLWPYQPATVQYGKAPYRILSRAEAVRWRYMSMRHTPAIGM